MKTIELGEIVTATIIIFLDSLEELGCSKEQHPVEWFKSLPDEEKIEVGQKLLEIIEREDNE